MTDADIAALYAASRRRLLAMGPGLSAEQQERVVAATPLWTVADVYRHLTGLVADLLDGTTEGAGSPQWTAAQWTAAQVAARADMPLADVCTEWAWRVPDFEARLAAAGTAMARAVLDIWTHEQDIRGALELGGLREDPALPDLTGLVLAGLRRRWADSDLPSVRVCLDDGSSAELGAGSTDLQLRISRYELLRMALGRRSSAQVRAAGWAGGDPSAAVAAVSAFDLPAEDVHD